MNLLDNISTLLFDFDNTLVLLNENDFVLTYGKLLAKRFTDVFPSSDEFLEHLFKGSYHMITKEGSESNVMKFFDYFGGVTKNLSFDEVYSRFQKFYEEDFDVIKSISKIPKVVTDLFSLIRNKFEIVIATNPLFPEIATKKRLEWIGLLNYWEKGQISLVTHAELFSQSKPNLAYYEEILKITGKKASECLMIGNDIFNDGAASILGIKFFHVINDGKSEPDFLSSQTRGKVDESKIIISDSGSLLDLFNIIKNHLEN